VLKTLFPFQKIGAAFLTKSRQALLADEPGVGKTVQVLSAVEILNLMRILVICPASVISGWIKEIIECLGEGALSRFTIISYNKAKEYSEVNQSYDALVLDEAHYLKTPDSQRTQAVFGNEKGLARRAKYVWALTGTPIPNRPRELYPVLKCLADKYIAPYNTIEKFEQRFCGAYWDGRGMNARGSSHMDDLFQRLNSGFMLRRTMDEVLPQLPPAVPQIIPFKLSEEDRRFIIEAENSILNREEYISTVMEDFSQLGDSASLMKATGLATVRFATEFVKDQLNTVEKVVVYAWHRDVIFTLFENLQKFNPVVHMGGLSAADKDANKLKFMRDPSCRVLIGNIESSGVGLNGLQEVCRTCVFAEIIWGPGRVGQAVRRLRRLGMDINKGRVNAYILNAEGTIQDAVLGSNVAKSRVIDFLMGDDLLRGLT